MAFFIAGRTDTAGSGPGARAIAAVTATALIGLVVSALVLRVYHLDGRSLWLDEILSSQPAHLDGPSAVVAWSRAAINQMPLFYLFTWLFGRWGDGAIVLRLPAAIAGTLLVPCVYLVGRATLGVRAGLIAALLTVVLPFTVWYSQEARAYSLLMLLTTLQMYFAFKAVTHGRSLEWAGLAATSIANLYTHYVALAALAAVVLYVAAFVVSDLLKGTSDRVKAGAGLLAAVALAAVLVERRAILHLASELLLRSHGHRNLLLAVAVVAAVLLAVAGAGAWRMSSTFRRAVASPRLRRFWPALGTAVVIAIAYAPWLSSLRLFLSRPDQSLGQIHVGHTPGVADLAATLGALSLSGFLLLMLVAGLVALVYRTFAGHAAATGLILAWIGVPVAMFAAGAGPNVLAIDARYVSFLVPAALIAIAAGVDAIVTALQLTLRRTKRRPPLLGPRAADAAAVVLCLALLAQAVPALAASYGYQKNDWRATAQRIAASNPQATEVISLGNYADWSVICLEYYFRQLQTPIVVEDGRRLNSHLADRLRNSGGEVWGIVIFPSTEQMALMSNPSTVKVEFEDSTRSIWLVQPGDSSLSAFDQASTLLRWELPLQPELASSLAQLTGGST